MSSVVDEMRALIEADMRNNVPDDIRKLVEADVRHNVADEMRALVEEKMREAFAVKMIEDGILPMDKIAAYILGEHYSSLN